MRLCYSELCDKKSCGNKPSNCELESFVPVYLDYLFAPLLVGPPDFSVT